MATPAAKALETVRAYESGNDIRQMVATSEGGRAFKLLKRREETRAAVEKEKEIIENETKKRKQFGNDEKFSGGSVADDLEEEFRRQTVGLVSAEEFKAKRQAIDDMIKETQRAEKEKKSLRLKRTVKASQLSFEADDMGGSDDEEDDADEDDDDDFKLKKKTFGKDPTAKTSFLYDADREAELARKKKELMVQYKKEQEEMKKQKLEVTYSYWDGAGHRRTCIVEKGFTMGQLLSKAKGELEKTDFPELRTVGSDTLMYVKEDLIIPHNVSFYDLIKEKARGKSGPLFNFDVHEDVRMSNDSRIEKDESHAGKIVDRKWYERNKHVFPASRWEMYTKDKTFDKYTISGDKDFSAPLQGCFK